MGGLTTYDYLKKNGSWLTAREIAKAIGIGDVSVRNNLNVLMKNGSVKFKRCRENDFKKFGGWRVRRWKMK